MSYSFYQLSKNNYGLGDNLLCKLLRHSNFYLPLWVLQGHISKLYDVQCGSYTLP